MIEIAGRTCYKSEDKIGCTLATDECSYESAYFHADGRCAQSDCDNHSSNRFVKMLIKRGHHAMLEHGGATVKFVTNRGVTHELVRHRLCAFGQESTRYVNYGGDDIQFILPSWMPKEAVGKAMDEIADILQPVEYAWAEACAFAEGAYKELLEHGWQPQEAREVMPNSLKTEIVVTANWREWRHIMALHALGTTGKPHPQMQALMLPLLSEFKELVPPMYRDWETDRKSVV